MNERKIVSFSRKKKVTISFDGRTQEFILAAPSAKDKEDSLLEAQKLHAATVKLLNESIESIKAVYHLQDKDLLIEAVLEGQSEQLHSKAALTLAQDTENYEDRLNAKVKNIKDNLRVELQVLTKEQLSDKLCSLEMDRQVHLSWMSSVLHASLVRCLCGDDGERLFSSVEKMKESLPDEVLEKILEAFLEFLAERGSAQVFHKPHTSKG